jgi:hypothetical protein
MDEKADSFIGSFDRLPSRPDALDADSVGFARKRLEARKEAERKTQLSEKQRRRKAVRTTQINFRCTPAFRELSAALAKHLDCSVADLIEEAVVTHAKRKKFKVGGTNG